MFVKPLITFSELSQNVVGTFSESYIYKTVFEVDKSM